MGATDHPRPRSLTWATDLDVLGLTSTVDRRADHLLIRSPSNPTFWWGNFLLFDDPPSGGDGDRWEALFAAELPGVAHRAFGWDRSDGSVGEAQTEFITRGYRLDRTVGLVATPAELIDHPRANRDVSVRPLDPAGDEPLWEATLELQAAGSEGHGGWTYEFGRARQQDWRALFRAGRGAWYVAITQAGEVAGSCGVVVTAGRGRYQVVDTAEAHRREGICSRLIVEAGRDAAAQFGATRLVIAADPDYHAATVYESVGFVARERGCELVRPHA